jgi:hypothetical protein
MTDLASRPSDSPACPACCKSGVALLAGESDGGWWFVCLDCDALWDQRRLSRGDVAEITRTAPDTPADVGPFWRRLPFRFMQHRPATS